MPNHDATLLASLRQQYDDDTALLEHMDREHSKLRAEHQELEAEYDGTSKQLGKALVDLATSEAKVQDLRTEVERLREQLATSRPEYEPAVPVPEPVTPHPDWAKHKYGCGGGRQCRCVIPDPDVRPDPNQACAAHDDAHLSQVCPDRTVTRPKSIEDGAA